MSAASRQRCSYAAEIAESANDSERFGVDARVDGVRWPDIMSPRIFDRIDPLSLGGENYRRSMPNVMVYDCHTRFGPSRDARHTLRVDAGDEFTADKVVIAAGSRVVVPGAIAGCGVRRTTPATRSCESPKLPTRLVIVGGGYVATEFAHIFSSLGSHVSLVIRGSTLLRGHDDTIMMRFTDIAAKKWEIHDHRQIVDARQDGDEVVLTSDDGSTIRGDALLVATGRAPNGDLLDAELAGVDVDATAGSSSTNTNAPPRGAFTRSATSSRTTSSSTSRTTKPEWCGTTCCTTGTTPTH